MSSPAKAGCTPGQSASKPVADVFRRQKRLPGGLPTLPKAKKPRSTGKKAWAWQFAHVDSVDKNKWRCKFCHILFATDNITRFKKHLLNSSACCFLKSTEAAAVQSIEVMEARDALCARGAGQGRVTNCNKTGGFCITVVIIAALHQHITML